MQKAYLAISLAIAVLSAAGAQAGMGTKVSPRYDPVEAAGLARSGLPTVILGQAAAGANAAGVRALLRPPGWLGSATFVDAAPATASARLVILFNPGDPAAAKREVCGDVSTLSFAEPGARLVIRAAYCIGDEMVTRVTSAGRAVDGLNDPRLAKLMRQVVSQLFPRTDRSQFDSPGL